MASTDISTSSNRLSAAASEEADKRMEETLLNKMKSLVEKLRLDNATLKKSLDLERSGVRALKAQHEATLRLTKTEYKKKEEALETQLRCLPKLEKQTMPLTANAEVKKLSSEIQSLKASNKGLQEKLKVAAETDRERAAELRAQAARHAAREGAARKDARTQVHKLLEEIKSKERMMTYLKKAARSSAPSYSAQQPQRMEAGASESARKLRSDQEKERSERDDLKTDLRHRKETFYREAASDGDSAMSSAPASLSPQPLSDTWACGHCRAAGDRAELSAREAARLSDALRDARDQLELLEFRLLELEDAAPDKGPRENLTDSDSGCVSPGSRLKDSASPEFRRMDSGYKSPSTQSPTSPCGSRRTLHTPLLEEESDSLRNHLEQMILNAASAEDRGCLEQVLVLLHNLQTLSSSVSDDDCYQIKPKKLCDIKTFSKLEIDVSSLKSQKVIATISPYSQSNRDRSRKCSSLESLCSDDPKKSAHSILQESGIFEDIETDSKATQTEVFENFECNGDLNTEIQRLNSIREKLEKRAVVSRNRSLRASEEEGLECRCVKLGKRHKQYYERRLKFLEGKISIYEAAPDVKKAKLAERLQKDFVLENRVHELESQLSTLQEKYEQLEEDCCELEEIENDTRLHAQQLETDYELANAQLRDMNEQRDCTRVQAERLLRELREREVTLTAREAELKTRLTHLERAVPALIAWNVTRALGCNVSPRGRVAITSRLGVLNDKDPRSVVAKIRQQSNKERDCGALVAWKHVVVAGGGSLELENKIAQLMKEKAALEAQAAKQKADLEKKIAELQEKLCNEGSNMKRQQVLVEIKIQDLERQLQRQRPPLDETPIDATTGARLHALIQAEKELKARVRELERREAAYLEMLTQADDMWAEMEGGYKRRIEESERLGAQVKGQMQQLESDRNKWRDCCAPLKKQVTELAQSETGLRVSLEKTERDKKAAQAKGAALGSKVAGLKAELTSSQAAFTQLNTQYKKDMETFRQKTNELMSQLKLEKESNEEAESQFTAEVDKTRKDLARTCKHVQELDVTNSELREEVESLESQLALMQKTISQCKRKCDEKIKMISHELSIKTEELEELRSEMMRKSLRPSIREEIQEKTEYTDDGGYTLCTAVPKKVFDFNRMHHSLNYITSDVRCSCPSMRSQLVGSLIEDLFERIHNTSDEDLTKLCTEIAPSLRGRTEADDNTKAKIMNYLLMAISKELVRSIGDADAKTDTEEWQRAVSTMTYSMPAPDAFSSLEHAAGNVGVLSGAARLASVTCACAAARLCASLPDLADSVNTCQEEVLEHSDVKIMEEQLANAIENIVNCPSCALGTNAIIWSTDV